MKTVVVTGILGQLGWELERSCPASVRLVGVDLPEVNITQPDQVARLFARTRPHVVINAAAYTAVDRAEQEAEAAYAVNRDAVRLLAEACAQQGAHLVHVSTDFVFDGTLSRPIRPSDLPNPLGVYGASKLAGEKVALDVLKDRCTIVRTAWLYSSHGANFVKTMLRLFDERDEVHVVSDQVGTPTWAANLADFLWAFLQKEPVPAGIYHFTDAGVASWYDFAVAVEEETRTKRGKRVWVRPIRTEEYPTPARRPSYSVLDKHSAWALWPRRPDHWREALRRMLHEMDHAPA
ncbi:dTDP-4-dehydrorhamnose reductase [Desulfosoma caldarium]|uniref:dTDP-4-dehydrorhamnose reductase n=1 Tax=Desulfosoma caldarium TaxID=610254 RepID=A0A3N1VMQ7_9BACT|nr:dTDP-4-dehydrorhamnose reductase [Desulfosoma caldarium]ROR01502.1 dTDP-4-dehydrorhamnose reductase [Desulfosoma caldarium]